MKLFNLTLTAHDIGFILCGILMFQLGHFWISEGKEIYKGFRGADGKWQPMEVFAIHLILVWTIAQCSDHFFGFRGSSEAWGSLNIGMAVAVLGISYKSYLKHSSPMETKSVTKSTISGTEEGESEIKTTKSVKKSGDEADIA